jgi:hypothetical protein
LGLFEKCRTIFLISTIFINELFQIIPKTMPISNRHELREGIVLEAYSLDPDLTNESLDGVVGRELKKPVTDSRGLSSVIAQIGDFSSFRDLGVSVSPESYSVPEGLKPYRFALGNRLDCQRKPGSEFPKNGNVAIIVGEVKLPLLICQGGYYDFKATEPGGVPKNLEDELKDSLKLMQEFDALRKIDSKKLLAPTEIALKKLVDSYSAIAGVYPEGKTVRDLFAHWGIPETQRARYLGCAHLIFADNGKEWMFVQRAKGLGVAADCMSSPGSTPDPRLRNGFDLGLYMKSHLDQEMDEEFGLRPNEYDISGFSLYDDKDSMPFMAVRITTPLKTKDIAERCFGNKSTLSEHTVLYSVPMRGIDSAIPKLPLYYSIAKIMKDFTR